MKLNSVEFDNTFRNLASVFINLNVIGNGYEDWGIDEGQDIKFIANQFSRIQPEYSSSIKSTKPNSKHC